MLAFFNFFVGLHLISSIVPALCVTTSKHPGISSCSYYGRVEVCLQKVVPIEKLPSQCSSFFFDGLSVYDYNVTKIVITNAEANKEFMENFSKTDKPFFVYYGRATLEDWLKVFQKNGSIESEIEALQSVMNTYKFTGIVIKDFVSFFQDPPEYLSQSLRTYAYALKKSIPSLSIGLSIKATVLQDYGVCYNRIQNVCYNFKLLNEVFDFFSITFEEFNLCEISLIRGGVVPIDGYVGNTLTKFKNKIRDSGIAKDKMLFSFSLSPKMDDYAENPPGCTATMTEICVAKGKGNSKNWCADNTLSFYEKGIFAREIGGGFIAENIDINDPERKCECKWPYPSFYCLLNGFIDGEKWATCPLFDRKFV